MIRLLKMYEQCDLTSDNVSSGHDWKKLGFLSKTFKKCSFCAKLLTWDRFLKCQRCKIISHRHCASKVSRYLAAVRPEPTAHSKPHGAAQTSRRHEGKNPDVQADDEEINVIELDGEQRAERSSDGHRGRPGLRDKRGAVELYGDRRAEQSASVHHDIQRSSGRLDHRVEDGQHDVTETDGGRRAQEPMADSGSTPGPLLRDDELELFLLRNHQNNSPVDIGTDEEFPMAQDKKLRCNADSNVSVFGEQANLILTKTNSFLMSKGVRPKESYPCGKIATEKKSTETSTTANDHLQDVVIPRLVRKNALYLPNGVRLIAVFDSNTSLLSVADILNHSRNTKDTAELFPKVNSNNGFFFGNHRFSDSLRHMSAVDEETLLNTHEYQHDEIRDNRQNIGIPNQPIEHASTTT